MKALSLFLFLSILTLGTKAQDIEEIISKYTSENGKEFLLPLADCMGADFNSGLFHSASIKKMGFQLYIGIVTSAAFVPDKRRTFTKNRSPTKKILRDGDLSPNTPSIP